MFHRIIAILMICAAGPVAAQNLIVAIDTAETVEDGMLSTCRFAGHVSNAGADVAFENIGVEHRLRKDTFSAMTAPDNGTFGLRNVIRVMDLPQGGVFPYEIAFIGVDCADLDAVNFALVCDGPNAGVCDGPLAAATDSVLPMQIGGAAVVGNDLIAKGPLHGTWQVTTPDGLNLMTLEVTDIVGSYIEMTFRQGPDYCVLAATYCDITPAEMTSDNIYLDDNGDIKAKLFVANTSHRLTWTLASGIGTFLDMQRGWDKAAITVTRTQ